MQLRRDDYGSEYTWLLFKPYILEGQWKEK